MDQTIFVTGGTRYVGSRLVLMLLARGHEVRALTRIPSVARLPMGCHPVFGSAVGGGYDPHVPRGCTFVHLVGVAHPSPSKAEQFRTVDLASLRVSVAAAEKAEARHFVFVSVAHPAPAMKAYIAVREECEQIIETSGLNATILRPWYVLGPEHRWPYLQARSELVLSQAQRTQKTSPLLGTKPFSLLGWLAARRASCCRCTG
ncbi:MAG TPA: NAD(P)H-binding protein [Candidatus Angelobacter sp.]|nr:NAD(P)H-binding protein [Candidatus Angelobacter sp.]